MSNVNQLSEAQIERLAILAEECAETIHIIGKILRHGYESRHPDGGPTNRRLLEKEIADIEVAVDMLTDGDLEFERIVMFHGEKHESIQKYLHHQSGAATKPAP